MTSDVCAQCGHENPSESNFCRHCGAALAWSTRPSKSFTFLDPKHAERKLVSILFADIVGSTSIVEGLDPEDALAALAPAIASMKAAVKRFSGMIAREQGDGILAFFGVPKADDHHPINACLAALEIVRAVEHLAHRKMQARAGVHSGEVLVRVIDGEFGASYDASGAAVHLASRLESIAQPGTVLVSAATYTPAVPYFDFVSISPVIPKGFTKPIPIFSISGQRSISRWLARGGKDLSTFVGREAELDRLNDVAQSVAEGRGQATLISGTAGAGKSRLAHEFIAGLAKTGWSIIEAEAQPAGQATPYGVLKRILLSWLGCSELDSPTTLATALDQRFATLGPSPHLESALRSVLDLTVDDIAWHEAEPGFRRRRVINAFGRVISSTADSAPLVLLLEDLHWIDRDSASVLDQLRENLTQQHLLILGTARSDSSLAIDLGPEQTRIVIAALDLASAGTLLDRLLGSGEGLSKLKERLIEKTGGIPLFVEEVVRGLIDTGALIGSQGSYTLTLSPEKVGIPPTVQAIISTRVDALPASLKRVLQSASVLGQPITINLLEAMSDLPTDQLHDAVGKLQISGFLIQTRTIPELEFTFPHELIREVVYSALVREQRRALHDKALSACMHVLSDRIDEFVGPLAHHAYESQNWKLVLRFARQSAVKAVERSAFREAALQFQRAIESASKLAPSNDPEEIRTGIDVRLQSRLAFSATSQLAVWIDYAKQAEEMAAAIGDERRELAAIINRAQAMNFSATPKQSIEVAEPALRRAKNAQFRDLELLAWYIIGQANYAAGNYQQTIELLSKELPQLRGPNSLVRFGTAGTTSVLYLIMIAMAAASVGEFDRSRAALEEADEIARQTGRPYDYVACSYSRGILLVSIGQTNEAIKQFRNALDLSREYSINLFVPLIVGQLGAALTLVGQHPQAITLLEKVVRESQLLGHNLGTVFANYALAAAYRQESRLEESLELAKACLENTRRYGLHGIEVRVLLLLGTLQLAGPKPDRELAVAFAKSSIDLALALNALPNVAQGYLGLADIWSKTGNPARVIEATDSALQLFESIRGLQIPDHLFQLRHECTQSLSALPLSRGSGGY